VLFLVGMLVFVLRHGSEPQSNRCAGVVRRFGGCPGHRKTFVDKKIARRFELKKTEPAIRYGQATRGVSDGGGF